MVRKEPRRPEPQPFEFALTQVLGRPQTEQIFFKEVIRENLDIGHPDRRCGQRRRSTNAEGLRHRQAIAAPGGVADSGFASNRVRLQVERISQDY